MITGKLNPVTSTVSGATTAIAAIQFPGFQKVLDYTATGSESSVALTVNGDTDKEYRILTFNASTSQTIDFRINNDSTGSIYGYQQIYNNGGTVSAVTGRYDRIWSALYPGLGDFSLLTPTGFLKTCFLQVGDYNSGTTLDGYITREYSYNSTANVTSLNFFMSSGNFTSGNRISVFARRTQ